MTTRQALELDTVLLLAIGAIAGIVFAVSINHKPNFNSSFSLPAMQILQTPAPTPTAAPTPQPIPQVVTAVQISPDGTKDLNMTVTTNKNFSKTYAFSVSNTDNSNSQSIYSTTFSASDSATQSMSIPFNTWSPDDKYVFIQHASALGNEDLVMQANGQPFASGDKYFNITAIYNSNNTGNAYQDTTGWASDTLLIINTTQSEGAKGPSYWFELPDKNIVVLATQF